VRVPARCLVALTECTADQQVDRRMLHIAPVNVPALTALARRTTPVPSRCLNACSSIVRCHPDKHPNDATAASRFHVLKHAYDVLSDPKRRAVYDRTGDQDDDSAQFWEAYDYFRKKFPEITVVRRVHVYEPFSQAAHPFS
jgi:hypothetical protein